VLSGTCGSLTTAAPPPPWIWASYSFSTLLEGIQIQCYRELAVVDYGGALYALTLTPSVSFNFYHTSQIPIPCLSRQRCECRGLAAA
jgi:hypothetical protein